MFGTIDSMPEINIYTIVMAASVLIILSYVFSLISNRTRIPTVMMLLFLGIAIREVMIHLGAYVAVPLDTIRLFGVLGLILILLEAGLDLRLSRDKLSLIRNATASSLFVMALSVASISAVIHYLLGQSWQIGLIYSVPLSIISSAIVASSVNYLSEAKREFLTYESALSDIFGILLFNFLIAGQVLNVGVLAFGLASIVLAVVLSIVVSGLLVWLLTKADVNVKAFLIFAVLLFIYAVGHILELPTLLTVLVFGLVINNWHKVRYHHVQHSLPAKDVSVVAETVKSVTAESAFLIRTFFFTLFGYMVNVRVLGNPKVYIVGTIIVSIIFLVRFLYLRIFLRDHIFPELFFAPRGLVTIVLFYSIPASMTFDSISSGVLFYVIMLTTIIMMFGGMWLTPKEATREAEESSRRWNRVFSKYIRIKRRRPH